jgi:hypothetical protein
MHIGYIGQAIDALKKNKKVRRATWPKGSFIYMVAAQTVEAENFRGNAKEAIELRTKIENGIQGSSRWIYPHIDQITEFGQIKVGFKFDAEDVFASDWEEVIA